MPVLNTSNLVVGSNGNAFVTTLAPWGLCSLFTISKYQNVLLGCCTEGWTNANSRDDRAMVGLERGLQPLAISRIIEGSIQWDLIPHLHAPEIRLLHMSSDQQGCRKPSVQRTVCVKETKRLKVRKSTSIILIKRNQNVRCAARR